MAKPQPPPPDRGSAYDERRKGVEKTTERLVRQGMDRRQAERLVGDAVREHDRTKEK